MTHLLDSSAWLAHVLGEPGVEQVNALFDDPSVTLYLSALSLPEVYARFNALGRKAHWAKMWTSYADLFAKVLPVDQAVAEQAILLRAATPKRLPTIDALIAATAVVHELTLVRRDPHLAAIPANALSQLSLPTA